MPIKFRCPHCQQFLGISRAKAGTVTDCPTCGRTLRVPDLQGRVAPLPPPQLDLDDNQLVEALGALASLGSSDLSSEKAVLNRPAAPAALTPKVAAPPPEPLAPDSGEQEVIAEPVPHVEDASEFSVVGDADVLNQLRQIPESPRKGTAPSPRGFAIGPAVLLIVSLACLVSGGLIGWGVGRRVPETPEETSPAAAPQAEPAAPVAAPAVGDPAMATILGQVTYEGPGGTDKPDRGARVLCLPLSRSGTLKVSPVGLRVGADDADRRLLQSFVQTMGGRLTESGESGSFSLELPPGQGYGILVASRYQQRAAATPLPAACRQLLEQYFDRPEQLLGEVQFFYREFSSLEAGGVEQFDVHFAEP